MSTQPYPEILRAIKAIDQRIEALVDIKRRLAEEFGISIIREASSQVPNGQGTLRGMSKAGKSRKETLADYIRVNGPMSRVDIVSSVDVPAGTISYCLNDKNFFQQLEDGRWDVAHSEPQRTDG